MLEVLDLDGVEKSEDMTTVDSEVVVLELVKWLLELVKWLLELVKWLLELVKWLIFFL